LLKNFHKIPAEDIDRLSPHHGKQSWKGDPGHKLRETFHNRQSTKYIESCGECQILKRKPVQDIISWIENNDFTEQTKRVLLYGDEGVGKTFALNQIGEH
jgi:DNA replication protein DnaC